MTIPSVQTTTHTYPHAEIDAMTNFYGGKKCVISLMSGSVEWSHILDAVDRSSERQLAMLNPKRVREWIVGPDNSFKPECTGVEPSGDVSQSLHPCNERLSQMLVRKLRQDRHPRHAAEVQENVVPLRADHHSALDEWPPLATLFLHEDILARTLAYEQDLHQWRITELEAGRGDPGRPTYEEAILQVFGGTQSTQHRFHAANSLSPFLRNEGNGQVRALHVYEHQDCPGIDDPTSRKPFPIIDTLLSIPFSLLHYLPRLAAIVPTSVYQRQLVTMGLEIVSLWWWDPPPDLIEKSEKIRLQKNAQNQCDGTRSAKPYPIHHQSRNGTPFLTKQPIGTIPSLSWDGGRLLFTPRHEGLAETGDVQCADTGIVTDAMSSPVTSGTWDVQTIEGTDSTSDDIDGMEDVEEKPSTGPSSSDILSWYEQVTESVPEPLPLIPGSFERGVIGGMSTNDILMIKGLIDPIVYIQFFDLSLFSRL
ncbi:hypothetical protein F5887DRAFT_1139377 [Amanita rubescens]|nr:hypothetical protein F5887DRAFT_1139377 [Amanita rubescens]